MKFDSKIIPHAGWEMLIMRACFAGLIWGSVPVFMPYGSQPHPNGIAHWIDLTFLSNVGALGPLRGALAVALVFYVLRIFSFPALTVMLALQVGCASLENSQGAINHTFQPYALALLGQWLVAAFFLIRQGAGYFPVDSLRAQQVSVHAAKVALVSCYVASGITKLWESDGAWLLRIPNLASQIAKSNANSYLNALIEAEPLAAGAPAFIIDHPWLATLVVGSGLFLELFAFLALLGRRPAFVLGIGMILMHAMIEQVMSLRFPTFQNLALIFLVNLPYALVAAGAWIGRKIRRTRGA